MNKLHEIEALIYELFEKIQFEEHFKGYDYLYVALLLKYLYPSKYRRSLYKTLLVDVSNIFNTTSQNVEFDIRHLIEHTWTHKNTEPLYYLYGDELNGNDKPSISTFINKSITLIHNQTKIN